MKQLLTPEELAVRLNIRHRSGPKKGQPNLNYVWKMARENRIPSVKLPGSKLIRFDSEAVDALLFGAPDMTVVVSARQMQKTAVIRSLKTEKNNGKRTVVSASNRKDLLCL